MAEEVTKAVVAACDTVTDTVEVQIEECLICFIELDQTDIDFRPCECSFKICRFCWYRLLMSENPVCPMCRSAYDETPCMAQLKNEFIPKLEFVRLHPTLGSNAFEVLNLCSYLDTSLPIPIQIFGDMPKYIELLGRYDFVFLSHTKSTITFTNFATPEDLRRCADSGTMIQLAMEYTLQVLNPDLENMHYKHLGHHARFNLLKTTIPHALTLWDHILEFHQTDFFPHADAYFGCLCDRLDQIGFYESLQTACRNTFDRFNVAFGPKHISTLRLQVDLSTSEWKLGRPDEALKILVEILPLAQAGQGPDHWITMNIRNEMSFVLNCKGFVTEAIREADEVIRISKLIYGETHRDTLTVTRNKAILLTKSGQYTEAIDIFYSLYLAQKETLGDMSLVTISTQFWIGQVLMRQGHLEEALRVQFNVFEKQQKLAIEEDDEMIRSAAMLASLWNRLGQPEKAVNFCIEQSLRLKVLPALSDPEQIVYRLMDMVKLQMELAKAYMELEKNVTAQRILKIVYEIQFMFQGPDSRDAKDTEKLLTLCTSKLVGNATSHGKSS